MGYNVAGLGCVDRGLAFVVKELNGKGYPTVFSCSGLNVDHPGGKVGPFSSYVMFMLDRLTPVQTNSVKDAARQSGLSCYRFAGPSSRHSIIVSTRITKDGTPLMGPDSLQGKAAVLASKELGYNLHGLNQRSLEYSTWQDTMERISQELLRQHGGPRFRHDSAIRRAWRAFMEVLR